MLKYFTITVLDEPLGKVTSDSLDHSIAIKFALTAEPTEELVVMSVTRITLSLRRMKWKPLIRSILVQTSWSRNRRWRKCGNFSCRRLSVSLRSRQAPQRYLNPSFEFPPSLNVVQIHTYALSPSSILTGSFIRQGYCCNDCASHLVLVNQDSRVADLTSVVKGAFTFVHESDRLKTIDSPGNPSRFRSRK